MTEHLTFEVIQGGTLSERERCEVLALCSCAYRTDYEPLFRTFAGAAHILARQDGALVSHALWVTRCLQCGTLPPLRTAYVEAVATEEAYRRRGFATAVMQRLAAEIRGFELGGLSPAYPGLYARLGWELWRGPLFIRAPDGLLPTPGEEVMILRLPKTPALDLDAPLSAEWREGELW
jgi:aminoglycoside 2'-N-acetyltransferase I